MQERGAEDLDTTVGFCQVAPMTKEEILQLEIERRALLATADEMSKGDACMEVSRKELVDSLKMKAKEIQKIIDKEMEK